MKTQFTTATLTQSASQAFIAATAIISLLAMSFFIAEPRISHGQSDTTPDFRIRQISGITGGNATGTTQFVVKSNNASGYYVEIDFFDNAGAWAMRGDEDGGAQIRDYRNGSMATPSYNWTASTAAQFAYTVHSSTTSDTADNFLNNSSACGAGSTQTIGKCWQSPSTSGYRVVDRSTAANTGATSTLMFKVNVPSGANPTPTAQTYTATATLSVFTQ
jgi:hypothetical protein